MKPADVCYRNALIFAGFCNDVANRLNGKVTVGLSSTNIAGDKEPPNDLVINVSLPGKKVSKRVTRGMLNAVADLRSKLELVA